MDERENWLQPSMPVLSLLKARPFAQMVLDSLGLDPWADPRIPVGELSSSKGIEWPNMEAVLRNLPETLTERKWDAASLPLLLDHLVSEHAEILERTVPAIQFALTLASARGPESNHFAYLAEAWPGFTAELTAHMKEEEVFLFPRLLHYDFCVRHRGLHPDFSGGSVSVFIALHLLGNETRQMDALNQFASRWKTEPREELMASGSEQESRRLLEAFKDRLNRHNALETMVLFPRAKALEKTLYDAAISGFAPEEKVEAYSASPLIQELGFQLKA